LEVTNDGGSSWSHLTVPAPPSTAGATAFTGQPRFFGQLGVLPIAFAAGSAT